MDEERGGEGGNEGMMTVGDEKPSFLYTFCES